MSEMGDVIGFIQQLSTTSFEASELEITCEHLNGEWQFHVKSHKLIGAFFSMIGIWYPTNRAGSICFTHQKYCSFINVGLH